jgi:hypothetical protein
MLHHQHTPQVLDLAQRSTSILVQISTTKHSHSAATASTPHKSHPLLLLMLLLLLLCGLVTRGQHDNYQHGTRGRYLLQALAALADLEDRRLLGLLGCYRHATLLASRTMIASKPASLMLFSSCVLSMQLSSNLMPPRSSLYMLGVLIFFHSVGTVPAEIRRTQLTLGCMHATVRVTPKVPKCGPHQVH